MDFGNTANFCSSPSKEQPAAKDSDKLDHGAMANMKDSWNMEGLKIKEESEMMRTMLGFLVGFSLLHICLWFS